MFESSHRVSARLKRITSCASRSAFWCLYWRYAACRPSSPCCDWSRSHSVCLAWFAKGSHPVISCSLRLRSLLAPNSFVWARDSHRKNRYTTFAIGLPFQLWSLWSALCFVAGREGLEQSGFQLVSSAVSCRCPLGRPLGIWQIWVGVTARWLVDSLPNLLDRLLWPEKSDRVHN